MKFILSKALFICIAVFFVNQSAFSLTYSDSNTSYGAVMSFTIPVCTDLPNLWKGIKSPSVSKLQNFLKDMGYLEGESSGDFDYNTATAVIKFQQAMGLYESGNTDPSTGTAVKQAFKNFLHNWSYSKAVNTYHESIGLAQEGSVGPITRAEIKKETCPVVSTVSSTTTEIVAKSILATSIATSTKPQFTEIKVNPKYKTISSYLIFGGKLAYMVKDEDKHFIVSNAKEIGKEYKNVKAFSEIDDKLVYIAETNIKKKDGYNKNVLVYDGKEIGKEYDDVSSPISVNDKLAYLAYKDKKSFVVYSGKEYGKEYDSVSYINAINGKLVYVASKEALNEANNYQDRYFVFYDGKEVGGGYSQVQPLMKEIGTKLSYEFFGNDNKKDGVVIGGKEIINGPSNLHLYKQIDNKIAYPAYKNDSKGMRYVMTYDGVETGNLYEQIDDLIEIKNKLAFVAKKNGKYFLVYDGKEISKGYDKISAIFEVANKLTYLAEEEGRQFIVSGGEEIKNNYDMITDVMTIDDKIVYRAFKDRKTFVVYDGMEMNREDGNIPSGLIKVNNKLFYVMWKGKERIMMYGGHEIGKEYDTVVYDTIFDFKAINGKLVFLATKGKDSYIVMEK